MNCNFSVFNGLSVEPRIGNEKLWIETLNSMEYSPVSYTNEWIEYQLAYQIGVGGEWLDKSVIIFVDKKPIGLWPLSLSKIRAKYKITSQGQPITPPLFINKFSMISQKKIIKTCLDNLKSTMSSLSIEKIESSESFKNTNTLSIWHMESIKRGAYPILHYELYVNLSLELTQIKYFFRKGYKALISQGLSIWSIDILDTTGKKKIWDEFRALHLKVSGRITRSEITWNLQYQDIIKGYAFLIFLRDQSGQMIGGGFFNFSRDEAVYSVGVYDRSLNDKPLGHLVQFRAIQEFKKKGILWYKIGSRQYQKENPTPTEKELAISFFKEGFSTNTFPRLSLSH